MKTGLRGLISAALCVLLGVWLPLSVHAKDLEVCRLCGGKGDYHCDSCGNTGTVTCGGCGGVGTWVCPGEEGRGQCDHGYYVCPSCHGDGLVRSGDGEIPPDAQPGSCGGCGGTGRIECIHCHGTGGGVCDKCQGTGLEECQNGTCQIARRYDWKCPDCKGTGFILLGNPMPPKESNDGVRNVPVKGDYIVTNDKTWGGYTYTGDGKETPASSTSKPTSKPTSIPTAKPTEAPVQTEPAPTEPVPDETEPAETEPAETEPVPTVTIPAKRTWILDFGEGRFDLGVGRPVFVWMDGHTVSGRWQVEEDTPIWLEDLVPENMLVYLRGENGFFVQLIPDKEGNVCLSRRRPPEAELPDRVQLTVEFFNDEVQPAPNDPGSKPSTEPDGSIWSLWPLFAAGVLAVTALIFIVVKKRKTGAKS